MDIAKMLVTLRRHIYGFQVPLINQIMQEFGHDPYLMLIACLLSLRARDVMTIHVCRDLFARVKTPIALLALPVEELEKIIYRTGYYKTKARVLREVSQELLTRFDGTVPPSYEALISIKGVGPKTANLILGLGFGIASICVDTHVHRISNRLGLVQTKNPEETERVLRTVLPVENWIEYNTLLVTWGQNICVPISPKCSQCPLREQGCRRRGVIKSR